MRSKVAQRIMEETPEEVKNYVKLYADIVVRVNQLLKDKGITQAELAKGLNKQPSEISKWLSGNHNLTLKSLAKLHAELGEEIVTVPMTKKTFEHTNNSIKFDLLEKVRKNDFSTHGYLNWERKTHQEKKSNVATAA
jgi:transcriptional regulator with XRE-family HTH domain